MYEELHPKRSSYTWSKSIDKISREGDNNFRTANFDKQSRIDHILLSPSILDAVKSIEHIYYGRRISDHSAVVMKLDWDETNTGQGIFRCGADTHKNKKYQELIRDSFKLNLLDFVGDTSKQNELRANLGHILALKTTRDKVSNDVTKNVDIRDITVGELDAKIQKLSEQYPTNDEIISEHFSGKYSDSLVFLLHKAAEVTRVFNKKKNGLTKERTS